MVDAGAHDHTTAAEPSWSLTIALAAVIVVALLAGVFALADGRPGSQASAGDGGAPAAPAPSTTTVTPTSTTPTTAPAPTTATVTSTEPPPPVEPVLIPPLTTIAPWAADGFTVAFPSEPRVGSVPVHTTSGTVNRSEYDVDGPDGSLLSVTSVPVPPDGRPAATILAEVVARTGDALGAAPVVDPPSTVGGRPAQPFRVSTPDGVVRAVVVHGPGRLYTVSMFTPGHGPTAAADAVFDQLVASFQLV